MTLQQLGYVVAISEEGSFNKAAERLYISQPSLSEAIKELEKELGLTLFNRTGRGTTLTADGSVFLPYARSVLTQYEGLMDVFGRHGKRKQKLNLRKQELT